MFIITPIYKAILSALSTFKSLIFIIFILAKIHYLITLSIVFLLGVVYYYHNEEINELLADTFTGLLHALHYLFNNIVNLLQEIIKYIFKFINDNFFTSVIIFSSILLFFFKSLRLKLLAFLGLSALYKLLKFKFDNWLLNVPDNSNNKPVKVQPKIDKDKDADKLRKQEEERNRLIKEVNIHMSKLSNIISEMYLLLSQMKSLEAQSIVKKPASYGTILNTFDNECIAFSRKHKDFRNYDINTLKNLLNRGEFEYVMEVAIDNRNRFKQILLDFSKEPGLGGTIKRNIGEAVDKVVESGSKIVNSTIFGNNKVQRLIPNAEDNINGIFKSW